MKYASTIWACLCAGVLMAAPAGAVTQLASSFNVVVSHNFTGSNSDTEGRIAAGGNISVSNYAVALQDQQTGGAYAAIAGGAFTGGSGTVYGSVLANSFASSITYAGGTPTTSGTSPIDIGAEMTRLSELSADLAAHPAIYGTLGLTSDYYGQKFFYGSATDVNIFNIDGSQLANHSGVHFIIPNGSVAVVNVLGTSVTMGNSGFDSGLNGNNAINPGFAIQSFDARNILFNYYQATSVNYLGSGYSSILAPMAALTTTYSALNGQIFADSISGNGQINLAKFRGALIDYDPTPMHIPTAPVPEPATWATMLVGFGMIGSIIRRRRTKTSSLYQNR